MPHPVFKERLPYVLVKTGHERACRFESHNFDFALIHPYKLLLYFYCMFIRK